jgi:anti-anti-sigma factor
MITDGLEIQEGPLTVRAHRDSGVWCLAIAGEVDLSNAELVETALRNVLDEDGAGQVIVDMREVTFIDSTGIACLVRFLREDGNAGRLRFRRSTALGVSRVLQLTGIEDRLTPPKGVA